MRILMGKGVREYYKGFLFFVVCLFVVLEYDKWIYIVFIIGKSNDFIINYIYYIVVLNDL